jgi:predicted nucleic acid-binding protein
MRFWDSSALVPLVVLQATSSVVDQWLAADPAIVVWTFTSVELASAVARLAREGSMDEGAAHEAESRVDQLLSACHAVIDVEAVKGQARRLLRTHPLRAADALQLGAAWEWAMGRPSERTFHTFDSRLGLAARREGFHVLPPPT